MFLIKSTVENINIIQCLKILECKKYARIIQIQVMT